MLGIAVSLPAGYRTTFVCFPDRGRSEPFLAEARRHGFDAYRIAHETPHYVATVREIVDRLERLAADVLCCHGYKADLIGLPAARWAGIPVVSVSHGWTGATPKVRLNESLDRFSLRWMDAVVCVSEGQADKVRRAGVPADRVAVIRNAIDCSTPRPPNPDYRRQLDAWFPRPMRRLVGAAGRLSPEKGFSVLVEAAQRLAAVDPDLGFVLFGDGPLADPLAAQVARLGLEQRFVLAGFRADVTCFLPHFDAVVLPSFTEGLPVIVLEAFAASVPVVATAVGGTPEVVEDGVNGYLVAPGDARALADRIATTLACPDRRAAMGRQGRKRVEAEFSLARQGAEYQRLFERIAGRSAA